ncbi:GNAT family N-acetyltransferase [Shimia sp. NS0008-38b]|uniref:GNAT family N-acetyltransferase n=1 Tax=Shimia sp. NS0008-38b TaxID=3127653 RepID=UPI00310C6C68
MTEDASIDVHVRLPTLSDKSAWTELWAQYNAFYGREGDTALSSDVIENTWKRILDPRSSVAGLVAMTDGRMLGFAHVVFHDNLIQLQQTCYMQDLFTSPTARGRGVARALIDGISVMCRSQDVGDIYWHTQADNVTARRLYDQLGRDTEFVVYRMKVG